ncbi:MAG TPA: hypothetical protein VLA12_15675 [Planctomycetaceae bacterium]|nr:hypothetical protein [Planctomycetaceae bacterium]
MPKLIENMTTNEAKCAKETFAGEICGRFLYPFFLIMFHTRMAWWYPALLCAVIVRLQWEFGRAKTRSESSVAELVDF